MNKSTGVTLVELLVTLAIAGVLAAMAIPSFVSTVNDNRVLTLVDSMMSTLSYARSEAAKRGTPVSVCRSSDGAACGTGSAWNQGWLTFVDNDGDGSLDAGDTILRRHQGNDLVSITPVPGATGALTYLATGYPPTLGAAQVACAGEPRCFTFCRAGVRSRNLVINNTGRPRVVVSASEASSC